MENNCSQHKKEVAGEIKSILMITSALEKYGTKPRVRWMRVNKHLSGYYKTGKLINKLKQ